jgi:hexulose-6-phosphate isomerase
VDYLEGDNNWPAILRALDDIGYDGWGIAEPAYRPPGLKPEQRLKQVSEKLGKILAM